MSTEYINPDLSQGNSSGSSNSPGTGDWDSTDTWVTGDDEPGAVPVSGDTVLLEDAPFGTTVTIDATEYSAADPLGSLGVAIYGQYFGFATPSLNISGGSLYVDTIFDQFTLPMTGFEPGDGTLDFGLPGYVDLANSGTLWVGADSGDAIIELTDQSSNLLELAGVGPTSTVVNDYIYGPRQSFSSFSKPQSIIDLPNVAWGGAVTDVSDVVSDPVEAGLIGSKQYLYADNDLTFTSGGTVYQFSQLYTQGTITAADFSEDATGGTEFSPNCFAVGTRIRTESGEVVVEALRVGDMVCTASGRSATVVWLGRRTVDLAHHADPQLVRPIRIAPGAIAAGVPSRWLRVSPDHAILVDGMLIPARQLLNHRSITRDDAATSVTYYHVELDRHDVLIADGAPAESYLDTGNRGWFGEASRPAGVGLSIVSDEARVKPIWRRLAARVGLDIDAPAPATAAREVRLVVGGHSLTPVHVASGRFVFAVPDGADAVRLMCAAARPTDAHPWLDDRRRLGLAVVAVHCDGMELRLDGPAFGGGWWSVEGGGPTRPFRWTDGDATLRLPPGGRALTICTVAEVDERRRTLRLVA